MDTFTLMITLLISAFTLVLTFPIAIVAGAYVEPYKNWRAKGSEERTRKRIKAIEDRVKELGEYHSHTDKLIALVGRYVLKSIADILILVFILSAYPSLRDDLGKLMPLTTYEHVADDMIIYVILYVAVLYAGLRIMARVLHLQDIQNFPGYKVKQEEAIDALRSTISTPVQPPLPIAP